MEVSNNNGKIIGAYIMGVALIGGVLRILLFLRKSLITGDVIINKSTGFKNVLNEKYNDIMINFKNEEERSIENELIEIDPQNWRS